MKLAVAGTVSPGGSLVAETRTAMVAIAVLLPSTPLPSGALPAPVTGRIAVIDAHGERVRGVGVCCPAARVTRFASVALMSVRVPLTVSVRVPAS